LNRRPFVRALLASAAIATAVALAGCDTDSTPSVGGRHMQPLSDRMLADIETRNMAKESPILVRIFKEESELEVWKEDKSGHFALLRTYPICRWSGDLGPKVKEGDRQAPEGFYTITPNLMNPNSQYYLAINTGFPNAYDRANGRSGGFLMIHGDCSSRGCYAMTDEQIAEIYALARESFFGGQKSFQIQAYPFKMTPVNMARHRNSPHMPFWKMIKEGYDHFEVTRAEPKVDVCEKRYIFDAESKGKFSPAERCPAFKVPQEIASAVHNKQRKDDLQIAELVNRGTATVPVTRGVDGGMNPTFLAAVRSHPGATIRTASGTIPSHVNPPGDGSSDGTTGSTMSLASSESRAASVQVASASSSSPGLSGLFGSWFGSKPENQKAEARPAQPAAEAPAAKPKATAAAKPTQVAKVKPETTSAADTKNATGSSKAKAVPEREEANAEPKSGSGTSSLLNGAAPTVPAGGFEGRFGAWQH
jgi:murein L,D-transpeptidase YafK